VPEVSLPTMPIIDGIPFSELQEIQDGAVVEMREDGTVSW